MNRVKTAVMFVTAVFFCAGIAQAAGDAERGKRLARECFACHGAEGNSPSPINPKIGGQHERYLLLSLKQYRDGAREHSLMRGSVLGKTDQELEDIAAYYAAQPGYLTRREIRARVAEGVPQEEPGGGPPQGGSAPPKFDHSDHIAKYSSMLARAFMNEAAATSAGAAACDGFSGAANVDADGDGLADAYDAAPGDAGEFAADVSGDGVFEICSIQQLEAIGSLGTGEGAATSLSREVRMERDYQIVRDLDASGVANFKSIGDCGPEGNCMITFDRFGFQGAIDGQGHIITGLRISAPEGGSGGLIAFSDVKATVSGNQAIGGLVGDMRGAVYYSTADVEVSASRGAGALVGLNTFGFVVGSHAHGSIVGSNDLGGLVGMNTDAKVRASYAAADIDADGNNIGGLVGFNSLSEIRNSYATGAVTGADTVGGLVGRNNGSIQRSFAAGTVTSAGETGGLSGLIVDGEEQASFSSPDTDLAELTGAKTGWAPDRSPVADLIDYYCDTNLNGFIDPDEQNAENYIWRFNARGLPQISCTDMAGR